MYSYPGIPYMNEFRTVKRLAGGTRGIIYEPYFEALGSGGVFVDVKSAVDRREAPAGITYWSL